MRIDKWLWVARFFRTRSLAHAAVQGGRVKIAGSAVKPSRDVRPGERVEVRIGEQSWEFDVMALADARLPAPAARALYAETEASRVRREAELEARRLGAEPARGMAGRPTKRERRSLVALRGR